MVKLHQHIMMYRRLPSSASFLPFLSSSALFIHPVLTSSLPTFSSLVCLVVISHLFSFSRVEIQQEAAAFMNACLCVCSSAATGRRLVSVCLLTGRKLFVVSALTAWPHEGDAGFVRMVPADEKRATAPIVNAGNE